jgi:fructokinase
LILVAGEALVDVFPDGSARPGGSPFNVAIGLARLGARSALATQVSGDAHGRSLLRALKRDGVDTRYLRPSSRPTPAATVTLEESGSPSYAFTGFAELELHLDGPIGAEVTGFHTGSYAIVSQRSSAPLLESFADAPPDVLRSLDPNVRLSMEPDSERWRAGLAAFAARADLIKVSEEDLRTLFGAQADVDAVARSWLSGRCALVALTRGERGASLFTKSGSRFDSRAVATEVIDTVGAGDAFQSALLAGLTDLRRASPRPLGDLGDRPLQAVLDMAVRAGALTCARPGADPPNRAELKAG